MDKNTQISELQEKAFNGDKDALELYQEYVNRGEAPAIHVKESNVRDMGDMYKDSKTFKHSSMYGDMDRENPKHELSAIEKMMMGYAPKEDKEGEK
jgi:hypothetical protein